MITQILTFIYYSLFALTPLIWTSKNYELFEYNKMMFVYGATVIVTALWLLRMIRGKKFIFKKTPLDIPLTLFLLANIISTIFSIDPHTSIWGYYSRSNGGLLSLFAYLLLYWAMVSNFTKDQAINFLKAAVFGGVVVALYAIPEHFGASPSCLILTRQWSDACWVQDVQARVFATLGQPNWLAAYLAMLIFPALYFALTAKSRFSSILYTLYSILFYLALTFTFSRGGTSGTWAGLAILLLFLAVRIRPLNISINFPGSKIIAGVLVSFLIINLLFSSAFTSFKLIDKGAPPPRPTFTINTSTGTQLESGGTESGKIRLIVWKGALDIFRHYPLFGSGVETFAYTYYQFRPEEHNMVSEWDFLYNKAHNEYLNYLTTTGIVGFLSYMVIILTFLIWATRYFVARFSSNNSRATSNEQLLVLATLASYVSYLVQNFFGFSVVIIALFFYLFPGIIFLATGKAKETRAPKFLHFFRFIYKRHLYYKTSIGVVFIIMTVLLLKLVSYWQADVIFNLGNAASDVGKAGAAYNRLYQATKLNPSEPLYQSELSFAAASSAVALEGQDATLSAQLKDQAAEQTDKLLAQHPKNVSFFRTAIRTYFMLSTIDRSFTDKTLQVVDQAIALAPTDPKLPYNKALILSQTGKDQEAAKILEQVIQMKPNYKEAYLSLAQAYTDLKERGQAKDTLNKLLKVIPRDPQALDQLEKLEQ